MTERGVPEDRTREQWTADVLYHPPGKPGHVYLAKPLARIRVNDLLDLAPLVKALEVEQAHARRD